MAGRDLFDGAPPEWLQGLGESFANLLEPVARPLYDWSTNNRPADDLNSAAQKFTAIGDMLIPPAAASENPTEDIL